MEKKDFRIAKRGEEYFIQQKKIIYEWFGFVEKVIWISPSRIILKSPFDSFESAETRLEIYIEEENEKSRLMDNITYFYF